LFFEISRFILVSNTDQVKLPKIKYGIRLVEPEKSKPNKKLINFEPSNSRIRLTTKETEKENLIPFIKVAFSCDSPAVFPMIVGRNAREAERTSKQVNLAN
jgi:hypothetical protein